MSDPTKKRKKEKAYNSVNYCFSLIIRHVFLAKTRGRVRGPLAFVEMLRSVVYLEDNGLVNRHDVVALVGVIYKVEVDVHGLYFPAVFQRGDSAHVSS